MSDDEVDVRQIPKPRRHPLIFERFAQLDLGAAFTIVSNHEPKHLRDEFERDHPGRFTWECLETGPQAWRVRIGRSSCDAPRVLCNARTLTGADSGRAALGATWKLDAPDRQLDANLITLARGGRIETRRGPDLDVLLLVLEGSGALVSPAGAVELLPGHLVWLPRLSERSFAAGPDGISYLTVHRRRSPLRISEAVR